MSSIEDFLRRDPHIIDIIPGEEWDFPELNETNFDEEDLEDVKTLYEVVFPEILSMHYVIDDFVFHHDRQIWRPNLIKRSKFDPQELETYMHTKNYFRINNFGTFISQPKLFPACYQGKNKEELEKMVYEIEREALPLMKTTGVCPNGGQVRAFDQLPPMKKYEYVRDLKQKVYNIMQFLAVK